MHPKNLTSRPCEFFRYLFHIHLILTNASFRFLQLVKPTTAGEPVQDYITYLVGTHTLSIVESTPAHRCLDIR